VLEAQRLAGEARGTASSVERLLEGNTQLLLRLEDLVQELPPSAYLESLSLSPRGGRATGVASAPAALEPAFSRASRLDDVAISAVGEADPASGGQTFTVSFGFSDPVAGHADHAPR